MSGHRPDRVADQIRRILADLLRGEVRDPRVGFVTVTGVEISSDLRHARIAFSVLGDTKPEEATRALRRATPFLRRSLGREMSLRHVPELRFIHDTTLERAQRIDDLLAADHEGEAPSALPPSEIDP